jgi:enediyne biosynthesis protein E4
MLYDTLRNVCIFVTSITIHSFQTHCIMFHKSLTIKIVFILILVAYYSSLNAQPLFKDMSAKETGIAFENTLKETPETNIITYEYYYNGGGVAAGDFNNDGLIDLYFTANLIDNKLYLNKGNFTFQDITKSAGVAGKKGWKTGVSVADVNGDGFLDIYVCYSGDVDQAYRHNQLFINNGNSPAGVWGGTFTDKAKEMGVDDMGFTTQAAFFDMDRDGDLDLFVLNHNTKQFRNFDAAFVKKMVDADAGDRLYENTGGKFTDVTLKAGIVSNPLGYGLGISITDINNDGWADMYVTNDYIEEDYLYINNKNGTFSERLKEQMGHLSNFSMGVDAADINNDGWVDIFTLDMLPEDNKRQKLLYAPDNFELYNNMVDNGFHHQQMRNMLQLNNGNGTFSEIGQLAGISNTDWSWAALLADYNNDGQTDLFVTNGYGRDMINRDFMKFYANERTKHLQGKSDEKMFKMLQTITATPLNNYIFENQGNLQFADRTKDWGFEGADFAHGAIYADLDNDGDLDIVFNRMNQTAGVYKNQTQELGRGKHFIQFLLRGGEKNTQALGAKVTVYTPSGQYMKENYPVHGFQSAMSIPVHMGIPDAKIDSVLIRWADGSVQVLKDKIQPDKQHLITKNTVFSTPSVEKRIETIFAYPPDTFPFLHKELMVNDFKVQPLVPNMVSYHGPKTAVGDVDKDGLQDLYICAPEGQAGGLFFQQKDGSFKPSMQADFTTDAKYEDTDAVFFDADSDGDLDLYVVSGGFGNPDSGLPLQDRFYQNVDGNFIAKMDRVPTENVAGSVVVAWDFDKDGDTDLFIGSRVQQGKYPIAPSSLLLVNDGKGYFTNETDKKATIFSKAGMVTDAVVADLNKDGKDELIVCGEWSDIKIYGFNKGFVQDETSTFMSEKLSGWWNTLTISDLDNDGDLDLIAGNWGENAPFKPSKEQPMTLYYDDFDQNGFIDPLWCYYIQGKSYPSLSRDELADQMTNMRPKFVTYDSYANATISELFTKEQIQKSPKLEADFLKTVWFENVKGKLEKRVLPQEANFSSVYAILADDFDGDGKKDLLLAGNVDYTRIRTGKTDANYGCLLKGDGRGGFQYIPQLQSGLTIKGCVRSVQSLTNNKGEKLILTGINNSAPLILRLSKRAK